MASIFTTLFQNILKNYSTLDNSLKNLFDAGLAVYNYKFLGSHEVIYSILMVLHVLGTNMLLLNYLIAIISTAYSNMQITGIFLYKVNVYEYCERFIQAF